MQLLLLHCDQSQQVVVPAVLVLASYMLPMYIVVHSYSYVYVRYTYIQLYSCYTSCTVALLLVQPVLTADSTTYYGGTTVRQYDSTAYIRQHCWAAVRRCICSCHLRAISHEAYYGTYVLWTTVS